MSKFVDFFYSKNTESEHKMLSEEDIFKEATDIQIPSLKAFTAWLILNNHLKPTINIKLTNTALAVGVISCLYVIGMITWLIMI